MTTSEAWKERYRARVVHWTVPAESNRRRALAGSNRSGVSQLYAWDLDTGGLTQVTDRKEGTTGGAISPDGRWIYYLDDRKGDEIGHLVRVPANGLDASGEKAHPLDLTPEMPLYTPSDLVSSPSGETLAFAASMSDSVTVFVLPDPEMAAGGEARPVYRTDTLGGVVAFDDSGALVYVTTGEREKKARYSLLAIDVRTGERVNELWDGPGSSIGRVIPSPIPGDTRVVASTDVTGDRRPILWDARTGERVDLPCGDGPGEVIPWDWSPDGREILICRIFAARQELACVNVESGEVRRLDHRPGVYGYFGETGTWFAGDGNIVAQWQDAAHPATVVLLDRETGHVIRELLPPTPVPDSPAWRSAGWTTEDGQEIQGWLLTPPGGGPFPTILDTHGGPESVSMEAFAPRSQAWVDHGFAVLAVNYRGGTTFGRAFKEAIWGHPGDLEVKDMVAGRQWLVDNRVARPDQVFLSGWSYGGYLTLHALGTAPGLWAGGMAGVAVADWVSEYEDENDVLRAYDRALFGGTPAEKMEAFVKASPLTYTDQVDAPVLIIQGRNDTRCPARQVELYEAKMRAAGKPIEVIWFDAGHAASADVERAIEHQAAMLDFAKRVLAGPARARS